MPSNSSSGEPDNAAVTEDSVLDGAGVDNSSTEKAQNLDLGNPVHLLALGFGSGLAPKAPGTFGTLVAIPIYLLMQMLPLWAYLGLLLAMIFVGIWICEKASSAMGVHDHPSIVWDEIAGFCLAMTALPFQWYWIVAGFLLFRLFDIWKPWPINWFDNTLQGGKGIMVDDLVAGLYVLVILHSINSFI